MSEELLAAFASESAELLEDMEDAILSLEAGGADAIDRLFRCVHTLKGSAGIVGFGRFEDFAHRLEDRIARLRDGRFGLGPDCVSVLLASRDRFAAILLEGSSARAMNQHDLELLAELDGAMEGGPGLVGGDASGDGSSAAPSPDGDLDGPVPGPPPSPAAPPPAVAQTIPESRRAVKGRDANSPAFMRVQGTKLERILSQSSGLVVALSNLGQAARALGDEGFVDQVSSLETMAASLYRSVLETRMVPFGDVASRYARAVGEIAAASGKDIRFELSGADTEIDKSLADRLAEPLLHLVRNAADHGIEAPALRLAAGKPAQGCVALRARRESSLLTIRIEDDGAGIDADSVLERARAAGLVGPEERPDGESVMELLFEPGFSMSGSVTRWSGRGVGLDVVKRSVAALRGRVRMESSPGKGSAAVVRLPLALSLVEGFIARVGELVLLVPYDVASRCREAGPRELGRTVGPCRLVEVDGKLLPSVDLGLLYGEGAVRAEAEADGGLAAKRVVIHIQDGAESIGLVVDSVGETVSAAVRPLDRGVADSPGVAGTAVLGDGSLVLVLDSAELCRMALRVAGSLPGAPADR